MGIVRGFITLALMIAFAALVIWAWGSGRRKEFERAAREPLEDDTAPTRNASAEAGGTKP